MYTQSEQNWYIASQMVPCMLSTKYIIVKRSEVGPEFNVVKLTNMCFFVFDMMIKDYFSYNRVSQTMFNQSVNRTRLGFLVKLHWMERMYMTDSINEYCFWGILHYIPWSTPWLYFWMKHLWNIVWSKAPVRSFLGNSVDWESGKAPFGIEDRKYY